MGFLWPVMNATVSIHHVRRFYATFVPDCAFSSSSSLVTFHLTDFSRKPAPQYCSGAENSIPFFSSCFLLSNNRQSRSRSCTAKVPIRVRKPFPTLKFPISVLLLFPNIFLRFRKKRRNFHCIHSLFCQISKIYVYLVLKVTNTPTLLKPLVPLFAISHISTTRFFRFSCHPPC